MQQTPQLLLPADFGKFGSTNLKAQSGTVTEIDFTAFFKGPRRDQDMGRGRRSSFDQVRRRIVDPVKFVL